MDVQMPDGTVISGVPDNITQSELLSRYQTYAESNPAPAQEKEGAIYGVAANVTPSLASGIGSLMQFPGQIADLVTGTAPGEKAGLGRTLLGTVIPFGQKTVQEAGEKLQEVGREAKTVGLKEKERDRAAKLAETEGELNKFGAAFAETITDPSLTSSFLFEQLPNAIGGGIGGLLTKAGGKLLFKNATQATLNGMGVTGAVVTGAAQQGADIGYNTYKDIYEQLIKDGMKPEEANVIAAQKGRVAAAEAGALSYALSKIPGAREFEKALFKGSRSAIPAAGVQGIAKSTAKGVIGGGLSETGEEVGGVFASNIGKKEVFPETELTGGMGEAAAMALIGGPIMEGAGAAINARSQAKAAQRLKEQEEAQPVPEAPKPITPEQITVPESESMDTAAQIAELEGRPLPAETPEIPTWDTLTKGQKVTLYRGEDAQNEAGGMWWTTNRAKAEKYGAVSEVTLDAEQVARNAARGQGGADEFVFTNAKPADLVAQPAQVAQTENVQPSEEDIVRLDDKGEPIEAPKEAAPKEVLDPNIEAQLAAEPFDPDSIILPPKEEPPVRAPKAEKVKASENILSAHEFIASLGGLNKKEASEINKDDAKSNVRIGNKWLYASKGGLSAAQAAEKLKQAGYITDEDNNSVYAVIADSLVDPVYSINDADAIAQRKLEERAEEDARRYEQRQRGAAIEAQDVSSEIAAEQRAEAADLGNFRQQMLDAGYTEQDLNVIGFTKASPELQAEVAALQESVLAAGLEPAFILETLEGELANRNITRQEYYAKAKARLEQAIQEKALEGGGRDVGQAAVQEGAAREEGLGSTDDISGQQDVFSTPVQISPEQQKIDALNKFEAALSQAVPPFRAASSTGTSVLRPRPLNAKQIALIRDLAGEAIDLGMPASLLEYISAAGSTRISAVAAIASKKGWFLLGKDWSSTSRVEQLKVIIHELAHSVDNARARISEGNAWQKANDELKQWHDSDPSRKEHPLSYPFDRQFNGKVRVKSESFAQAFSLYFVSPVDLQTNAPEAYSQIQSIVEEIQNESQRAGATSATKTGAAGVEVQSSRATKGTEVQSEAGEVGARVSKTERIEDRGTVETDEFKRWFDGSKVVDRDGKPLVMYHTTNADFSVFDTKRRALGGEGSWFSRTPVKGYGDAGENIMPVYLSLKNPKITRHGADVLKQKFIEEGYDGVLQMRDGEIITAIAFFPNQIKSTFNRGTFGDTENISFAQKPAQPNLPGVSKPSAKGKTQIPKPLPAAKWIEPEITWKDSFIRKAADRYNDLKTVQKAITDQVKNLRSNLNAYQIQDLAHGRIQTQTADFLDFEFVPILKEMQEKGITDADLTEYLWARHAEEANKLIAERNKNDPLMQDGGSGMKTQDAKDYLKGLDPKKKEAFESIAKKVDNILALTREMLEANGIISKEEKDAWESMFKHYVPLQRERSDYALPTNSYRSVGKFAKSRTGSTGKSVINILTNVGINREVAIVRIEKERVKRAVYGLAVTNPNPEFWKAVSPDAVKNANVLAKELEDMDIDPAELANILSEQTTRFFNKETGQVEARVDQSKRYADFVLPVKINGKDRFVFFNPKNPRAMATVTALKDMDVQALEGAMATVASATRFFAAVNTQYNLVFGLWNFARDLQGSMFNLTTTPIADKKSEVAKGAMKALPEIYQALRERNKGETPSSTKDGSWYDFISNGGKVGYRDQFANIKESTTLVEREFEKLNRGNAKKAAYALLNWVSNVNDVLENAVRLSSYRVALDRFKAEAAEAKERQKTDPSVTVESIDSMKARAAEIAKNITVNFNTKGSSTGMIGALYAFTNASIRGTARLIETVDPRTSRGRKIMGSLIALGAAQAVVLAMAGFDEDEPSEFIKQKNLVIPYKLLGIDSKKYFMIPMPYGLNVFPNFGRLLVEGTINMANGRGVKDQVANTIGMIFTAFNPIGGGAGMLAYAPTVLDPVAALYQNRDAFDRPIYREDRSTKPTPGYLRSRDQSSVTNYLAEFINLITGGTAYTKGLVSPTAEHINYLAEQVGGGVYREGSRAVKYVIDKATGEETPDYRVPIAGKIVGDLDSPASISQKFYSNIIRMSEHEEEIKGRISSRQSPTQYMKDHPEASLWRRANTLENELTKINRRRRELIAQDAPREKIKQIEDQRTRMMKQFNDEVRRREGR